MEDRKKIMIYPIHNEVIPQRVYRALIDPEIIPLFKLSAVAGREPRDNIIQRLSSEIKKRKGYGKWRTKHTNNEIGSLYDLTDRIGQGLPYFELDENQSKVPDKAYEDCDCVFIGTNNQTHVPYTIDSVDHDKHFITEKPYGVNENDLNGARGLEKTIKSKREHGNILTGKIAAHFSHKPASLTLFKEKGNLVNDYGKISKLEGFYEEVDDPLKPRTMATLDINRSGGGIFLDTGSQLEFILVILGGKVEKMTGFEWDSYPGYDVDTYAKASHDVTGELFSDNAKVEFTVGKFIDKYKEPLTEEHKELILEFNKGYRAHVLFSEGKIIINRYNRQNLKEGEIVREIIGDYPSNEYISVLKDFHECITTGVDSFTSSKRGADVMEIVLSVCKNFDNEHRCEKYGRNN